MLQGERPILSPMVQGQRREPCRRMKGDALIFLGKGEGKTASGIPMIPRPITRSGALSWSMTLATRGNFKAVEAHWHDEATGKKETVTAGEGSPVKRLRHTHSTKKEAEGAAQGKLGELKRGDHTLSIKMVGDPLVAAEGQIAPLGFRVGLSGLWSITSARHEISGGGFTTSIKNEKPKE